MPLTTPQDQIGFALRAIGVLGTGQSALAEDYQDAFSAMNAMIGQWNRRRWLIYHLVDVSVVSTGAVSYSVGPGGDFNVTRPDRLESAFFRQFISSSSPYKVDYPLTIIEAREDYNLIALKEQKSWPTGIFYDSAFPMGRVYPVYVPLAGQYEIHLSLKETIQKFTSYVQSINLPDEYTETIWTNLAIRLSAIYPGSNVTDDLRGLAKAALQTIRDANSQIPRLRMPQNFSRGGIYNIVSDTTY